MKALSPIHKIVAREMALGFSIEEICVARQLDIDTWKRISKGDLFAAEVKRIMGRVEEQLVEEAGEHPVLQTLKAASIRAANSLIAETSNFEKEEEGATATTRIAASKAVLEFAGFTKKEEQKLPTVVINISSDKAASLSASSYAGEKEPQNVVGEGYATA